ncbi:MAG TPA: hypothetical protein DCL77_19995 [Prolixibacteraceae bacterium]|jgi:hypothetical protein|nr:hypothetical protein [Prolixibacteraceae bacterium]
MKNRYIKTLIASLILVFGYSFLSAQESTTLYFMRGVPQSDLQNPALHNDSSAVVVGLPGLSGMSVGLNSPFAFRDLFHKGTGDYADSLVTDMESFHRALKSTNSVQQNFTVPLFYLGFRHKKSFFSLGISEKEVAQLTFAKNMVTFIKDGNAPYMGQNFDLGDIQMNAIHYREFALGYSNELIKNKLTVGIKVKALYGKSALQTERMDLQVETAADGSYLNLRSDMKINLSAPVTASFDSVNYFSGLENGNDNPKDYMLQHENKGMAFDLGAVYKLTPKITLSGSIIDMGKISFKKDVISIDHVSNYKWEGIDFSKSLDDTKPDYVSQSDLIDNEMTKFGNSFKPKKSEFGTEAFKMTIPTKIYLGGTYQFTDKFNLGLLDRLYKYGEMSKNTLTLSANTMLGEYFSLSGSYSVVGNSYNNLGLGMGIRCGFMQLYMVSDNLLAMDPAKAEMVNFRFGINLLFGRKHAYQPIVEKGLE